VQGGAQLGDRGALGGSLVDHHSWLRPVEVFVSQRSRLLAHTLLHIRLADATVGLLRLPLQSWGLARMTTLFPSPWLLVRLLQVAPFHPGVFCIETHFRVLLSALLLRSLARSCQPGWWRPTVKGSGWSGGRPAEEEGPR